MSDLIYWEKQDRDMLCAVHAINSLIQYPKWDAISLAEIGRELDQKELLISTFSFHSNQNVREDGYYSIQTITAALRQVNLHLDYYAHDKDPGMYEGFILNSNQHWIAFRKLNGTWFNLNSMSNGPKIITEFGLSACIGSFRQQGFTVFVATGIFPRFSSYPPLQGGQKRMTVQEIRSLKHEYGSTASEQQMIDEAIKRSLGQKSNVVFEVVYVPSDGLRSGGVGQDKNHFSNFRQNVSTEEEQLKWAMESSLALQKISGGMISEEIVGRGMGARQDLYDPQGLQYYQRNEEEELKIALELSKEDWKFR